ncbi:hypothetical protein BS50DRAFT_571135 [Corynespora cassiicola Philippines]|uniref:Anaphase-promoting complex, subunit CDC26 n=1 Tax=Corynespora cassiicola Philippines TaxID=1448308 RepID=A0A2T2NWJ5_CORCC|nr:hypothetical protein BS50DRAFT_571135 [Corynespora cassiicola Philippines]
MLRRQPTAITLNASDLERYEQKRQHDLWAKQNREASQTTEGSDTDKGRQVEAFVRENKGKKDRIMGTSGRGR